MKSMNQRSRRARSTIAVLLGCGAVAACALDPQSDSAQGGLDEVSNAEQPFNSGKAADSPSSDWANDMRGHVQITRKAFEFLRSRGLLPPALDSEASLDYVLYGVNFADNVWLGRPENQTLGVPNAMTARALPDPAGWYTDGSSAQKNYPTGGGRAFAQTSAKFSWGELPAGGNPFGATMTLSAAVALKWVSGAGDRPNASLRHRTVLNVFADVRDGIDVFDDNERELKEYAADNYYHYALADIADLGVSSLPADASSLRLYPSTPEGLVSAQGKKWADQDQFHKNVYISLANILRNQPLLSGAQFGAAKYGAILYQLARKFFSGSAAAPDILELIKAGNDVPGWHTGFLQANPPLNQAQMTFPHTYLGGNPFICAGSSSTDPCAAGRPTWPVWVPESAATTNSLGSLEARNPGRSNRAALIYLGWAAHMMQDLSVPHHAANWSGGEHQEQDDFGDRSYYYDFTAANSSGKLNLLMDNYMEQELNDLIGPVFNPKSRRTICDSLGIIDSQVFAGSLNHSAVAPLFRTNAAAAYLSRKERATGDNTDPAGDSTNYAADMVKNAILGTMKLVLCATPEAGYWPTTGASGFAWSASPDASQSAPPQYSHNSSANNPPTFINWLSMGSYRVEFPGLGSELGGNVQVTAYGNGSDRCKVGGMGSSGTTLQVNVLCYDVAGQPVNSQFSVAYVRRAYTDQTLPSAYVLADEPSNPSYTPDTNYQWNSRHNRNTVQRTSMGKYMVTIPGLDLSGGTAQVTAYGYGSSYCKAEYWFNGQVAIGCYSNSGAPADSKFSLNYAAGQDPGGLPSFHYAWTDQPFAANYTPDPNYQLGTRAVSPSSCAPTNTHDLTVEHWVTGRYTVHVPRIPPAQSNVQVSAYGSMAHTCKVVSWTGESSGDGTQISVTCFDSSGNPVDSNFVVNYSSEDFLIC
jgi:hypothetical protein